MRIAIDARPLGWTGYGGIGRICRSLIPAIAKNSMVESVTVFVNKQLPDPGWENVSISFVNAGTIKYHLRGFGGAVSNIEHDVVLSLSPLAPRSRLPTVLLLHDLYALRYKEFLPWRFRFIPAYWIHWIQAQARVMSFSRRLKGLISVSQVSLSDLEHFGGAPKVPVTVAHPGSDVVFSSYSSDRERAREIIAKEFGITEPYIIYVGAINVQKNVDNLVRSYLNVQAQIGVASKLVIVGRENWPRYRNLLDWSVPSIIRYDSLTDAELAVFLAGAAAYVNLSLYEGFGIPVLEAMAAGSPVVVSNRGAFPEVVGSAGVIVDPHGINEVGECLRQLLTDRDFREKKSRDSLRRAKEFSWETMANETVGLLKVVLGHPS